MKKFTPKKQSKEKRLLVPTAKNEQDQCLRDAVIITDRKKSNGTGAFGTAPFTP